MFEGGQLDLLSDFEKAGSIDPRSIEKKTFESSSQLERAELLAEDIDDKEREENLIQQTLTRNEWDKKSQREKFSPAGDLDRKIVPSNKPQTPKDSLQREQKAVSINDDTSPYEDIYPLARYFRSKKRKKQGV